MTGELFTAYSTNKEEMVKQVYKSIEYIFTECGYVTASNIFVLFGMHTSAEYNHIGWDDIDDIYCYRVSDMADGLWRINFPDPKELSCTWCDFAGDVLNVIPIDEDGSRQMSPERFKELLDELDGNSLQTLKEKNARYSQNGDALHNFRSGAEIAGGTPAQACWGYLTKHLVALRDKVERNDFSNREDFLEKCQDTINYIRFLWCIGNEENRSNKEEKESK